MSRTRIHLAACCGITATLAIAGLAPTAAGQATPRIVYAAGAVAGPGFITYSSTRYCDAAARPARFRVVFRVFDARGRRIGTRTVTRRIATRCAELRGIPVRTGRLVGDTIRVEVTNLRTGRSASRRGRVGGT